MLRTGLYLGFVIFLIVPTSIVHRTAPISSFRSSIASYRSVCISIFVLVRFATLTAFSSVLVWRTTHFYMNILPVFLVDLYFTSTVWLNVNSVIGVEKEFNLLLLGILTEWNYLISKHLRWSDHVIFVQSKLRTEFESPSNCTIYIYIYTFKKNKNQSPKDYRFISILLWVLI